MNAEPDKGELRFFRRWMLATYAGWLFGFVFVVAGSLVGDLVGVEGAQFFLGFGMGAGIGFAQWLWARPRLGVTWRWVAASAIGMGAPFVVSDVVHAASSQSSYSLPLNVALGGLLVGLLQRPLLRAHSRKATWWVPACVIGWTLAAASVAVSGILPRGGWWLALLSLGSILFGGVILALVTGVALLWLLRSPPAA